MQDMSLRKNTSKYSKVPIDELVVLLPLIITIDAGVDQKNEDEEEAENVSTRHLDPWGCHINTLIKELLKLYPLYLSDLIHTSGRLETMSGESMSSSDILIFWIYYEWEGIIYSSVFGFYVSDMAWTVDSWVLMLSLRSINYKLNLNQTPPPQCCSEFITVPSPWSLGRGGPVQRTIQSLI